MQHNSLAHGLRKSYLSACLLACLPACLPACLSVSLSVNRKLKYKTRKEPGEQDHSILRDKRRWVPALAFLLLCLSEPL